MGDIFQNIHSKALPLDSIENIVIHKDGYPVVLETSGVPYFNIDGELLGYRGVDRDITNRKRAEEALRQSESKYRSMMESMVDSVYICSPEYKIEYMNPAMVRRYGRDATGEVCYEAFHGTNQKCESCVFRKVHSGDVIENIVVGTFDGRTYRAINMPVENQYGTISKMTVMRDITDYLEAVEDKEKTLSQLHHAQKLESIGNLAGGIAHDFNNILSAIIGYTELALNDLQSNPVLAGRLQEVLAAGNRAKNLVMQILTFARRTDEEKKPIRVDTIIKEALKFLRSTIPSTIEIKHTLASQSLILANATQIHQVVMNLCTNAAHALEKDGGLLEVVLTDISIDNPETMKKYDLAEGDYILLKVCDTGIGIEPGIRHSIFEPYVTTKEAEAGTGLGLAVVHGILESYSGKIEVDSEVGAGTTFRVYIPITSEEKIYAGGESGPAPTGTERILLVDDEASIAKVGGEILRQHGYLVTTRTNSVEALELFQANPNNFDLVISDMTMPGMTGDKMAIELMKIKTGIPVILCTGYSKKLSAETASAIGIKAVLDKPIVRTDLLKIVREVLDESENSSGVAFEK